MQVQSRYNGLHPTPEHQQHIRVHGTHPDSRPSYSSSPSATSPTRADDMHQNQYNQYQQHHQQQQQPPQPQYGAPLPPANVQPLAQHRGSFVPNPMLSSMFGQNNAGMNMPGAVHPGPMQHHGSVGVYHPSQLPPPGHSTLQQQQPQDGPGRLTRMGFNGKYNFALHVEQQPARARMCGFGDKDRRPITPPPCIKLIVTDKAGKRVTPDEIDGSFFILQVDLWDETATREVNTVRSNSSSPSTSISNASLTSYPPTAERPAIGQAEYAGMMYAPNQTGIHVYHSQYGAHAAVPQYQGAQYYAQQQLPSMAMPAGNVPQHFPAYASGRAQEANNLFTRNLIGSLTVNASVLKDTSGEECFWFVMQDLSVRTEGSFRLKMTFIDVGNSNGEGLNKGSSPLLATVFSDSFLVYSAKKFPGVIESTSLSKCFASQGIKIPIRKDVKAEAQDDQGGDDYDD